VVVSADALSALVGYERALLARLPDWAQHQIARVAEAWLLSCLLLASPLAYALWLIEHQPWLAATMGVFAFVMVLNLVRLSSAGGGAATHLSEAEVSAYRPALGSGAVIALLALVCAQPAQLPLWKGQLEQAVDAQRSALVAQHERALAELSAGATTPEGAGATTPEGAERNDGYREQLARCDFLVLRLKAMWRAPTRTLQLTGLYVVLVLVPVLWARVVARAALREYALERWRRDRRAIVRADRAAQREAAALLAHFPGYEPQPSPFADPPFNTRVAGALLAARTSTKPARSRFRLRWPWSRRR
jgi:hypothetical protein